MRSRSVAGLLPPPVSMCWVAWAGEGIRYLKRLGCDGISNKAARSLPDSRSCCDLKDTAYSM